MSETLSAKVNAIRSEIGDLMYREWYLQEEASARGKGSLSPQSSRIVQIYDGILRRYEAYKEQQTLECQGE